jgi:2-amino-4-hydroxy-6-hydroxymethyldihydropteridine diphosphokinase
MLARLSMDLAAQTEPTPVGVWVDAFIGLGANLGDARAAVRAAVVAIGATDGVRLVRQSPLYGSTPVDAGGGDYVNAVVQVQTCLPALALLHALRAIEFQAGRERPFRNAPRTLDLDVLLYGSAIIQSEELTLPHPRMAQRAFVLRPLADIAPQQVSLAQLEAVAQQSVWRLDAPLRDGQ